MSKKKMKLYDIYCRYSVRARDHDDALDRWDAGEAAFQEWSDVIEVDEYEETARG